jgi:PKD repeat protein
MQFKSTVNREVWNYKRDFWDESSSIESERATDVRHVYWSKWIYSVKLTVTDTDEDTNTVLEKAFI